MAKISPTFRPLIRELGPLDPDDTTPIRQDDFLRDGDGSIYWLMTTFLPGFRQFRYPAKLFTLTSLGLAALAGIGWDALGRGGSRRVTLVTALLLGSPSSCSPGSLVRRQAIIALFGAANIVVDLRPARPDGAYDALVRGLGQGAVVLALGLIAVRLAGSRPRLAGLLALLVTHADLAARQPAFRPDGPPVHVRDQARGPRIIEEAERAGPVARPLPRSTACRPGTRALEPHRIARPQPGDGPVGARHAPAEVWRPAGRRVCPHHRRRRALRVRVVLRRLPPDGPRPRYGPGAQRRDRRSQVVYFPRRSFDMWNARYFVVPMWPNGWNDSFRGYASMLLDSETIYPPMSEIRRGRAARRRRRNGTRSMISGSSATGATIPAPGSSTRRDLDPTHGLEAGDERQKAMQEITYEDDPIWRDTYAPGVRPAPRRLDRAGTSGTR